MRQAVILLFTAWLLAAGNALATEPSQDSPGQDKPEIEEVVVAATRAGLTILDIPVNTSILSRQDVLESSYKPTDEILRQIPGFSLLRAADSIAAAPTTSTVSLRGLGGNAASRTLVLLDGIPLHSPYTTEIFWARVPRHRIERIEVVRGGGANAWGNLSLGGVINIVTKKPGDRDLDFNGMAGYPGTVDLALSGNRKLGDWNLGASASGYTTDGYMNLPPEQQGPVDEAVRKDHGIISGRASWTPNERTQVNVNAGAFRETRHGGSALDINETEIRTLGIGLDHQAAGGGWWRLKLFYEDSELEDASVSILGDNESESLRAFELRPASVLAPDWCIRCPPSVATTFPSAPTTVGPTLRSMNGAVTRATGRPSCSPPTAARTWAACSSRMPGVSMRAGRPTPPCATTTSPTPPRASNRPRSGCNRRCRNLSCQLGIDTQW